MNLEHRRKGDITCLVAALVALAGFTVLAVRLSAVQLDDTLRLRFEGELQSERRVLTSGPRGRIVSSDGAVMAENRPVRNIVIDAAAFQRRGRGATLTNILESVALVAETVGRPSALTERKVSAHLQRELALPLVAWADVSEEELARFAENSYRFPGFYCDETLMRRYPLGGIGAHLIGYVGRDRAGNGRDQGEGDRRFNFEEFEMTGKGGLEERYDAYLRGVPGERAVIVDARGFKVREEVRKEAESGPDLVTTIDSALQIAAEEALADVTGACVVLDPRSGAVLALASSPTFDPNEFEPYLSRELWESLRNDPAKPLLNRAVSGGYAPASTFKTITALAGLASGRSSREMYECNGAFRLGSRRIRCSSRWGHGVIDLEAALKKSCNPFFCDWSLSIGTNALKKAAEAFGLGSRTGIDIPAEIAGVVPDGAWKLEHWSEPWYPGDLPQMSIGQGMLIVTPLQMARVAGGLMTGYLVKPRLVAFRPGEVPERVKLPFSETALAAVRRGMNAAVNDGGTGRRAGWNIAAHVIGKTGTAEIGKDATRRKNAWFIGAAEPDESTPESARDSVLAVALIVENVALEGGGGGADAAPRVRKILKECFGVRDADAETRKEAEDRAKAEAEASAEGGAE